MRYRNRQPYKVKPDVAEKMRELRAAGKSYAVIGGLCGVAASCAWKWLTGRTPKVSA